jgi:LmbE family N-acetylglucosaminyl deacetylase
MTVSDVDAEARFVVDCAHLGRSEAAWAASPSLAALLPLDVPPIDLLVVVAPHPDDEVLGAGGLLQILAGAKVRIEIYAVTDGEASHRGVPDEQLRRIRTAESFAALHRLDLPPGASRVRLGYPDGQVADHEVDLTDRLRSRLGPDSLCVAPWRLDGHPDHEACGRAAAAAARACGARLFEYPVWAWHWADPAGTDLPWSSARRLELDRRQTARKRWATTAFRSQIRTLGSPAGDSPVLPDPILRRFWRPFEVYIT